MNKFISNYLDWVHYFLLCCISLPLLAHAYLGQFTRYYADDFCFSVQLELKGIMGATIFYYKELTGRYSDLFFEHFTTSINSYFLYGSWMFLLIWVFTLVLLIYFINQNEKQYIIYYIILSSAILYTTLDLIPDMYYRRIIDSVSHTWDSYPGIYQSLYWIAGRNRLIIPLILGTITSILIFLYSSNFRGYQNRIVLFAIAFLTLFSGGFGETYVSIQTTILGLAILLVLYLNHNNIKNILLLPLGTAFVFSIISMIFIIIAPGNENRMEYFNQPSNLIELLTITWDNMIITVIKIFKWPGNILSLVQLLLISIYMGILIQSKKINNLIIKKLILILPIVIGVLFFISFLPAAYGLSKPPPGRVMIVPLYIICCLISFWGGMLGKYLRYKFNFQNNPIFVLVIILFCCLFSLNSLRDTKAILNGKSKLELFSKEYDKRENHILKEKNAGNKKVVVEQLNHFIGGATITQDSSFWVNECVSAYYGINVITK